MERRWLAYHAKKTEGILSLLLCCYDMPFVVKHSGGPEYKKYGIHNGSRCRLKAWDLDEQDESTIMEAISEEMIVLKAMPKALHRIGETVTRTLPWLTRQVVPHENCGDILDAGCR